MSYSEAQRRQAIAWKRTTAALPAEAKQPAPYINKDGLPQGKPVEFCLPAEYASLNLLPEVRQPVLDLFAELAIPWHAGVGTGPSNHLLSSQVQCANAVGQMIADPERILRAFGRVGEVLQIEPGRFLTFEYIGPTDFFNEAHGGTRVRGAHCTSVDAAFLHRDLSGSTELVLVEWKYTESYRRRSAERGKDKVRLGRYSGAVHNLYGPVRGDVLGFALLLDEPFYQLTRQQLLAHELETSGAEGASRVRSCTCRRQRTAPISTASPAMSTAHLARPSERCGSSCCVDLSGSCRWTAVSSSTRISLRGSTGCATPTSRTALPQSLAAP